MTKHAKLSPSSAHRWMRCPGSVLFAETFPNVQSHYAAEGSQAHERAAQELIMRLENRDQSVTPVPQEWIPFIEEYVQYCASIVENSVDPYYQIEAQVPIGEITGEYDLGVPVTGTADFICRTGEELHVVDLKFGEGDLVHAFSDGSPNPQLALYALGALELLHVIGPPSKIHLHIVQPRRQHVSKASLSLEELRLFERRVIAAAECVWEGPTEYNPSIEACKYCPGKGHCKARADFLTSLAAVEMNTLAPSELSSYLAQVANIRAWCDDIEDRARRELMQGSTIPGFKLVEGRSTRRWTPEAETELPKLLGDQAWKIEKSLIGVIEAEKRLGKGSEDIARLTTRAPGPPKVVPESDPRPPAKLGPENEFETVKPSKTEET